MGRNYSQKILKMIVFVIGKKTFPRIQQKKEENARNNQRRINKFFKIH